MTTDGLSQDWLLRLARWAKDQPEISELWVFGSRAWGDAKADSDLDLAVLLLKVPELSILIRTTASWHATLRKLLPVDVSLDVMNDDYLHQDVLHEIAAHGRMIFCRAASS